MRLRDGSTTDDPRLDRLVQYDPQSKNYPAVRGTPLAAAPIRNMTWPLRRPTLNQGDQGRCVEFSICHELLTYPAEVDYGHIRQILAGKTIYCPAQRRDPWAGTAAYCDRPEHPYYEGTSALAGVQVAHELGWFREYRWLFSLGELLRWLSWRGPVLVASNWYSGMMRPDADGFIAPTGSNLGGHMYLVNRNRTNGEYVEIPQTWGPAWGDGGYAKLRWRDLERLQHENGEAVVFVGRRSRPKP